MKVTKPAYYSVNNAPFSKRAELMKKYSESYYGFQQKHGRNAPFITPKKLAEQIQVSERTLARWRAKNEGPPYHIFNGTRIRYPIVELEQWLNAGIQNQPPSNKQES
jgi:hypothetical protein